MKKQIFVLAVAIAAACGLTACDDKAPAVSKYDKLNEMLDASYSQLEITVTEAFADENLTLTSEYTVKYSESGVTVSYTVEKLAEIALDSPSSDVKTTLAGEAVIKGGVVVSHEGDFVSLSSEIAKPGFCFKEEYFENADLTEMYLKADVKDVSGFLGTQLTCTDMKVNAAFVDAFHNINIVYLSESGNEVKYEYVFTL